MAKERTGSLVIHGGSDPDHRSRGYVMERHTHKWTYMFWFHSQERRPTIERVCLRCQAMQANRLSKGWIHQDSQARFPTHEIKREE